MMQRPQLFRILLAYFVGWNSFYLFQKIGFITDEHMYARSLRYHPRGLGEDESKHETNVTAISLPRSPNDTTIYGHLHYAKTAGSTINGILAAKYERVCGHKGYSYDAYQYNERVKAQLDQLRHWNKTLHLNDVGGNDVIRMSYKTFGRGRVPLKVMDEIGYENCDYISTETPWKFWQKRFKNTWNFELHVPCRDPVQHLLSQCNHRQYTFNCQTTNVMQEIEQCLMHTNRFDPDLVADEQPIHHNHSLKCFNPVPVEPYLAYMGERLHAKRTPANYVHRSTNRPHNKSNECLLFPKNQNMTTQVREHMTLFFPYYRWCAGCMKDPQRNLLYHYDFETVG